MSVTDMTIVRASKTKHRETERHKANKTKSTERQRDTKHTIYLKGHFNRKSEMKHRIGSSTLPPHLTYNLYNPQRVKTGPICGYLFVYLFICLFVHLFIYVFSCAHVNMRMLMLCVVLMVIRLYKSERFERATLSLLSFITQS